MARRVSRRKEPDRDKFRLKERWKIEEGVFDNKTMMNISRAFTHGITSRMIHIISKGKEADVYFAEAGEKVDGDYVVLKIFREENSNFKRRVDYVKGDPRFDGIRANMSSIVRIWCRKEYGNLKIAGQAGVSAPEPYFFSGNVLAMQFIGNGTEPAKILKLQLLDDPGAVLEEILRNIRKLYKRGLVHADISEYNILINKGEPFLIDFGQAVVLGHPKANTFLLRDIRIILDYFRKKYDIDKSEEEVLAFVKE